MARFLTKTVARAPGLKRLPVLWLLALADVVILARAHAGKLTPTQRRRIVELTRKGRGMTPRQRDELADLIRRAEPRLFAGELANSLSPLPLPKRVVRGPKAQRA